VRIGLLSDVHGNLSALRAVAKALEREGPLDGVVVAGDLLLGGPRPREVWELLQQKGWSLVRGNEDEALLTEEASGLEALHRYARAYDAQRRWARARLGPEILQQLALLPDRDRVPTPAGDLLVVHSSPRSVHDRAGGIRNSPAEVTAAYDGTGASAIAFGHYHRSFVRPMPFGLLINVASVAIPEDQRPLASFTILHTNATNWVVEQSRIPYDAAGERAAAARSGIPPWLPD
jgi:predicted phosphodiesterase